MIESWQETPGAIKQAERERLEIAIIAAIIAQDRAAYDLAINAWRDYV